MFIEIFILFIIFILIQIYFYYTILKKNNQKIANIESFTDSLNNINQNQNQDYILDDQSVEILLDDYNKLKNNV